MTLKHSAFFTALIVTVNLLGADIFVSPNGNGDKSGASWSNAVEPHGCYVNAAITAAINSGAAEINIYYAGGEYSITQQVILSSIKIPIKISGGYAATTDGSLERSTAITKLNRNTSYNTRFINASSTSSIEIHDITLSDGRLVSANAAGAAAYFTDCPNVVVSNCTISSCTTLPSGSNQNIFGGGIYALNSNITFSNCQFEGNRCGQGGTNVKTRGGALFVQGCTTKIENCNFIDNKMQSAYNNGAWGGAIFTTGGTITIMNSRFIRNKCANERTFAGGGALALRGMSRAVLINNYFENCYANLGETPGYDIYSAGYLYIDDLNTKDQLMTSIVERCVFNTTDNISIISSKAPKSKSTILLNGGRLFVTNSLFCNFQKDTQRTATNVIHVCRKTVYNDAQDLNSKGKTPVSISEATLSNVTIADGNGVGAGAVDTGSQLFVQNCIIRGNTTASLSNPTAVEYSCLQEEHQGEGNFVEDPLWTGYPYYHLKSRNANSYINDGYFGGCFNNEKQKGFTQSPCIDAGAPNSPNHHREPHSRGTRINLGAYGGTPWASKSFYQLGSILYLK